MKSGDIWQSTQHGGWGVEVGGWWWWWWKKAGIAPLGRLNHENVASHQLSGFSCVSMSTRQIGHFLLVASHWSTQPWWKRCIQGSLLQDRKTDKTLGSLLIHMVKCHFAGAYSYELINTFRELALFIQARRGNFCCVVSPTCLSDS